MKRALIVSYHFPPIGGAGAQRPTKVARYLRDFGYEPIVVTGPVGTSGRWMPADEALAGEIPPELEVVRVAAPEPPPEAGWRERGERWLGLETPWKRWWTRGLVAAGRAFGADASLIYVWMQPYESAEAAMMLASELRKPLVADLGDPWALDEMMIYPTGLHRRRDLGRMRAFLGAADSIVMSTPEAVRRVLAQFPETRKKPVVAIPNGFDAADFSTPLPPRDDGAFRIVHTGYLHTDLGRRQRRRAAARRLFGGSVAGLDILTRSHVYLLQAVEQLIEADPKVADTIEIHLAGVATATDEELARRSSAVVRMLGYLSHEQSVALLRSADLLFLPMQDLAEGTRATIVPGKTYEYLASGRPILAAVPDGDARDLLAEAGNALLCRPADIGCLATTLEGELRRFRSGAPAPAPRPGVVARYEYRKLVGELAGVFDDVLGRVSARRRPAPATA